MGFARRLFVVAVVGLMTGCAMVAPQPGDLTKTRPTDPRSEVKEIQVPRDEFTRRISQPESMNNIRLVRVYLKSAADGEVPEYKIFNLQTGGPYSLLGLQNGDVLISAQNFVVRQPFQFVEFVKLMSGEPSPTIQIRRGVVPLELRYKFEG